MFAFGPVPSRRLGRSVGINPLPAKRCSYACVYCQVGPTPSTDVVPRATSDPQRVAAFVADHVERVRAQGEAVDVLTFVPDGEPTLDADLGRLIDLLRPLDLPVAVLTNASLLFRPDVRERVARADIVSIKVDASSEETWRRVNRPDPRLAFERVEEGIQAFARAYRGRLLTETMLVGGVNDGEAEVRRTARRVAALEPAVAYLAVPTRPGAVPGLGPPDAEAWTRAAAIFTDEVPSAELLTGYEGEGFGGTGDAERDLLATAAVHPLTTSQVADLLRRDGAGPEALAHLIATGRVHHVHYRGRTYYARVPLRSRGSEGAVLPASE